MKIAVVGTGVIGISHLQAIAVSEYATLCAVCDINENAAKPLAKQYGAPYFTDYREIPVHTDAEAVILNLPHWLHADVTEYFLDHGLHVLVEKPMANTVDECDRMIAASRRNDRRLAVGHIQRFFAANRKVREVCAFGTLGELSMFTEYRTVDYFAPDRPKWFLNPSLSGGGILMNYGAHALDKLQYVTGCSPTFVKAQIGNLKNDCAIEGHAQVLLAFDGSFSASLTFNGYQNAGYETVYYFTNGALKVVGGTRLFVNTGSGWEAVDIADVGSPFVWQLEEFCRLVRGESADIATGDYSRRIVDVIGQAYRSAKGESTLSE